MEFGLNILMQFKNCWYSRNLENTNSEIEDYPRRRIYCPVKLSIFLVLCKRTSWGSMATASKYMENVHITCKIELRKITSEIETKDKDSV